MPLRGRTNLTEESFFFVTTTVVDFVNVFKDTKCCEVLISNIKHYQKKYNFDILAYVIMPSHSCLAGRVCCRTIASVISTKGRNLFSTKVKDFSVEDS
ncbi:MAG TPA: hypothetical protein ENI57_05600, partial [Ignavibacteria bacterium]|nr:hypothetical protein [Ignavibacteria bacterium]